MPDFKTSPKSTCPARYRKSILALLMSWVEDCG
jgi:hypothetical protein